MEQKLKNDIQKRKKNSRFFRTGRWKSFIEALRGNPIY
jgi:hypothetical protein